MPTYVKRVDISGVVEEHGVAVASTTDAVAVRTVLTEATLHFSDASGYTVGETVTETDSTITGVVYWVDTGTDTVGVVDVSGEFVGEKTITGGTSLTAKIPASVRNLLDKTAETPRFSIVLHSHEITSTGGADPQTILLDERTEWFVVNLVATATVTVNNDATANVLDIVAPGKERAFRNTGREIQTVLLEFSDAGTCNVIEYNGEENPLDLIEGAGASSGTGTTGVQLTRTTGYEQPAVTDNAQIVYDVSVKFPPPAEYRSPIDFTAAYTSNVTLTLASLPITLTDDSQIKYIRQVNTSNNVFILANGINGVTFTEAADVITIAGAGTPLTAGDVYEVGIDGQRKAYDATNKLTKTQDQSPGWSRFAAWTPLVTSAQDLTGAWVTMGSAIGSLDGYQYLRIAFDLDGNDSRDVNIRVVYETEAAGTKLYPYDPNKWTIRHSSLDTTQTIRTLIGTASASLDSGFSLEIALDNCAPAEIKVQVMAGTVGGTAGQIDLAEYKKGN